MELFGIKKKDGKYEPFSLYTMRQAIEENFILDVLELYMLSAEESEPLSQIIQELNQRFGTDFADEDKVFIRQLEEKLAGNSALKASVRVNPPENARLTFDHVVNDRLQEIIDSNFKFYKQVTDNQEFSKVFLDWLFERYLRSMEFMNK